MTSIGRVWVILTESLATIAFILTALGLMVGVVKPADAIKQVAAILGALIVLLLIPQVLKNLLSGMSVWQWIGLATIGIGISLWWRPPKQKVR